MADDESVTLNLVRLRRKVETRISNDAIKDMMRFIKTRCQVSFWGGQQPNDFLEATLLMVLYHDLFKVGYQRVCRSVQLDFDPSDRALIHNASIFRYCLKNWAKTKIKLGDLGQWRQAARHVARPKPLDDVCLWTDSTDIPLTRGEGRGRKSDYWSYKLNKPGRRYLCFFDGLGQLRRIFGGHSPKWHDAELLKSQASTVEEEFNGASIIGDQHFEALKGFFTNITFHAPFKHNPIKKKDKLKRGHKISKLTRSQIKYNQDVRTVRARVERPFSWLKQKFSTLNTWWEESEEQLDCLVFYAFGCYNMR